MSVKRFAKIHALNKKVTKVIAATQDFIDSLNSDQFAKLTTFFNDVPALKYDLNFKCSKCGKDNNIELAGLSNFFG